MSKHYVGNEQETNRTTIQIPSIQQLRELYLLLFEMSVKDGKVGSIMCVVTTTLNTKPSCESKELLTDVLRTDWGFTGYVDPTSLRPRPRLVRSPAHGLHDADPGNGHGRLRWLPALAARHDQPLAQIDKALERRFRQMFKYGIFDRPIKPDTIDYTGNGEGDIGSRAAVLRTDNSVLPFQVTRTSS